MSDFNPFFSSDRKSGAKSKEGKSKMKKNQAEEVCQKDDSQQPQETVRETAEFHETRRPSRKVGSGRRTTSVMARAESERSRGKIRAELLGLLCDFPGLTRFECGVALERPASDLTGTVLELLNEGVLVEGAPRVSQGSNKRGMTLWPAADGAPPEFALPAVGRTSKRRSKKAPTARSKSEAFVALVHAARELFGHELETVAIALANGVTLGVTLDDDSAGGAA